MFLNILLKRKQFIKYVISGTLNTLITLIAYNILIKINVNYIEANIIAYLLGIINGFICNKFWVFKSDGNTGTLFIKFIIVNSISIIFSSILLILFVNNLYFNKILSQLMSTIITGMFNYMMNKLWTFS
ncbi:GtrA family protein [Clostridium sp. HV4-5-A1G]|uniref:GtrA family protein n=1 Tax=Clostridium sp. HV4-5-A1G TaxID=2004595 RepID=UPI0012386F33|nr:GtrA family protein [Clostridium sp. HV4-5-A1G]KAA8665198.1 GtrA family protein [Clostridium sp. HV4-5-A1G]